MQYSTTLTQKGQVTIQKEIRKKFNIEPYSKVLVSDKGDHIEIRRQNSILDIAGKYKAPRGKNAIKAREFIESNYERS